MLWQILVLLFVVWLLQRQWRMRRQISLGRKLKTNLKSYPIIGHMYMFLGSDEDRMRVFETMGKDSIKAGGISKLWNISQLMISVVDPVVADVLMKQCLEKHSAMDVMRFLIGNGSIYAPVSIWRPRRKILALMFSAKHLHQFAEIFTEQSRILADLLQKEAGQGAFSFWDYISRYSFDAICETSLGVKVYSQDFKCERDTHFLYSISELFRLGGIRITMPWLQSDFVAYKFMWCYDIAIKHRNTIWEYVNEIINQKLKTNLNPAEGPKNKIPSFLNIQASEKYQRMTEREMFEEIVVLLIAGTDTTATGLSFSFLMLSRHPDVQEKVFQELDEVFEDSSRPVTATDLHRLKYVEAVLKETLRLYPPVPITARQVDKDVTLPSGITIVQGCGILINHWAIHRHPDHWGPDPDNFRPERFLDPTPKHPAAFIPFSYGPRNCIGSQYGMMSMKTVMATLLRRYRFVPLSGIDSKLPVRTKFNMMLRDVGEFKIRLENRRVPTTSTKR